MRIKHLLLICAAAFAAAGAAAERPEWQGESSAFDFIEHGNPGGMMNCAGGLSLKLAEGLEPVFYQEGIGGQEANSCVELPGESGFINRMHCVGAIGAGRRDIEDMRKSWVNFSIEYTGGAVHVSRLTPAILVESSGKTLSFSNDPRSMERAGHMVQPDAFPVFFAYEDDGGEIHAGVLAPGEMEFPNLFGEKNVLWMLFWYGPAFGSTMMPLTIAKRWQGNESRPLGWYKGDQPILFVFSSPVSSLKVAAHARGLTFNFAGQAGRTAVVQPWEKFYQLTDTSAWFNPNTVGSGADELPAPVAERCRAWAKRLQSFPIDVEETWETTPNGDVLIREKFSHLPLDPDAQPEQVWMPVPPMWAVAMEEGFPVEFGHELEDTGVYTLCGPYRGFYGNGEYEARIPDIERYWRETRRCPPTAGPLPGTMAGIAKKLEMETDKVIEAGLLAPWIFNPAKKATNVRWDNPGETLYYLGACLDLLPPARQAALTDYLRKADAAYPAESSWIPAAEGARRERGLASYYRNEEWNMLTAGGFAIDGPAASASSGKKNTLAGLTPAQNLYYIAALAAKAPDALARPVAERWNELKTIPGPYLARLDWASGSFFWAGGMYSAHSRHVGQGRGASCGVIDQNHWFAGCVGLARLAGMAGDAETRSLASYLLARAALTRFAMAVFVPNLYRNGCQDMPEQEAKKIAAGGGTASYDKPRFYEWKKPEHDVRQALRMDQFTTVLEASMMLVMQPRTIIPFVGMVPELGRFLRDNARGPSAAFIGAVETMPNWHMAWAEDSWGREQAFEMPECAQQIFMAKAWIQETPAEKLADFIDISWTRRGDLYYIQKLAETLRAFRGVEWTAAFAP